MAPDPEFGKERYSEHLLVSPHGRRHLHSGCDDGRRGAQDPGPVPQGSGYNSIFVGSKGSNFSIAGPYTEWLVLGSAAVHNEGKLMWDSAKGEFSNNKEATKWIKPAYRKGWEVKL